MKLQSRIIPCLFAIFIVAGCASTKITNRQKTSTENIPRPGHIIVYNFAATAEDVPADSSLTGRHSDHPTPQTAKQLATGRKLGAQIAEVLVEEIRAMGMPARRASQGGNVQINDIVIRGHLISVHEGSKAKRFGVGLGTGASELKTVVEGYQMTAQGMRKLGSGETDAEGGKTPGAAVGLAVLVATSNPLGLIVSTVAHVHGEKSGSSKIEGRAQQTAKEIADQLKIRFKQEGWIK